MQDEMNNIQSNNVQPVEEPMNNVQPNIVQPAEAPMNNVQPNIVQPAEAPMNNVQLNIVQPAEAPMNNVQPNIVQPAEEPMNNVQPNIVQPAEAPMNNVQPNIVQPTEAPTSNAQQNNTQTKQCKKCKEKINKKAKVCPYCRAKQGFPVWLIVIIVIIGLGVISGGESENNDIGNTGTTNDSISTDNNGSNNNSSQTPNEIEYIKVSKDDLDKALDNNAAAAKDTYYKKYVEITGKLGTIDSDLSYITLMSSTDEWDFIGVHCSIETNEQKDIVKTLTKDQDITIRGRVTDVGEVLGYYVDIIEIIAE